MDRSDVLLVRWPDEDHQRATRAGSSRPTVLVIERGGPVPRSLGPLEDWLYDDAPPEEVALRLDLLASRVRNHVEGPVLDDGLLRHRGRWVAISEAQLPVVELLLASLDQLVPLDALAEAYASTGSSTSPTSLRALLHRLGRRVRDVDLCIDTVRGRGAILRQTTI